MVAFVHRNINEGWATKNIFKQAQTVFPSEKCVRGYFLMERAYIFFASKKNIGALRKNPVFQLSNHILKSFTLSRLTIGASPSKNFVTMAKRLLK